ncbi:MFS transporter permease [Mobiluncus mulieris]|uniref:MFS transporter permease n=1 Tax=Mobiluncus mulieris TaxID=2052 RepID=A0A7Y0U2W0_9ACTO|nr:MFS transporter permease [Mobiluncus mulieris]
MATIWRSGHLALLFLGFSLVFQDKNKGRLDLTFWLGN